MANNPVAILVDFDEANVWAEQVRQQQFHLVQAPTVLDASSQLDGLRPDLAIIALDLPDGDGLTLLKHPGLDNCREIILISDNDDPDRVRQGLLAGASYFFFRPACEQFMADLLTDLAVELQQPPDLWPGPLRTTATIDRFGLLHGSSPAMHKLYRSLRKLAPGNASVLLLGESGCGKELAARTIHQLSKRSTGPFVTLNCSTLPKEAERELFGQEQQGAGGPRQTYPGYLERAYGGTLFLEQITELSSDLQVKLLRSLETNCLRRLGGLSDVQTDLRVVATTTRAPNEDGHSPQLREDLYLRIATFPLHIPPLRSRGEDIRGLAELFLAEFNHQSGTAKTLSRDTVAVLEAYSWPGNIRELRSIVERAHTLAEQDITPDHLPNFNGQAVESANVLQLNIGDSVQDAEKKLTLATLSFYNGDKRKTAQTLGVSLKTLYNRINAYQAATPARSEEARG